jgi:hypothetical protein
MECNFEFLIFYAWTLKSLLIYVLFIKDLEFARQYINENKSQAFQTMSIQVIHYEPFFTMSNYVCCYPTI